MVRALAVSSLAALAGCWRAAPPLAEVAPPTPAADAIVIRPLSFGPIDARTPATLPALCAALPGLEVRQNHDEAGLEYNVYAGKELVLYVVPGDDGEVYNVHATSGRVTVEGRLWRVGAAFHDTAMLTTCECWGGTPTCWQFGDHIAVNFARGCGDLPGAAPETFRELDGQRIARIVWSPIAFGHGLGPLDGEGEDRD